jgi:hypothetical protein
MPTEKHDMHALLQALNRRLDSIRGGGSVEGVLTGLYSRKSFGEILAVTLEEYNRGADIVPSVRDELRETFARLTRLGILPPAMAYAKRYFCEMAYYRGNEDPQRRFIYKAVDTLCKTRGYCAGIDDPRSISLKRELDARIRDFYAVYPTPGWITSKALVPPEYSDPGGAAYQLVRLLMRLFFSEGLGVELLKSFEAYEPILYSSSSDYRDHFIHVVYDFLLGCRILDAFMDETYERCQASCGDGVTHDEHWIRMMRRWLLASLLHDVGYAAETLGTLRNTLQTRFFSHVPGFILGDLKLEQEKYVKESARKLLYLISAVLAGNEYRFWLPNDASSKDAKIHSVVRQVDTDPTTTLLQDQLEQLDHGVVSALFLLLTLSIDAHEVPREGGSEMLRRAKGQLAGDARTKFDSQSETVFEDIVVGCHAIALHNMRQRAYPAISVSFTDHPIAFLLMLCDDLQEWDRKADWERTPQALKAIYGFDVFKRTRDLNAAFETRTENVSSDGKWYKKDTFFGYLRDRLIRRQKAPDTQYRADLDGMAADLSRELALLGTKDRQAARLHLTQRLEMLWPQTPAAEVMRAALVGITNDVVTLTFVGGDPAMKSQVSDRIRSLEKTLRKLLRSNLTDGPAVCILHGYDQQSVDLFLVAEYDEALKEYVFIDLKR